MKKIIKNNISYLIIITFFLFLCYLFPYTGDDWAWGSEIGIERFNTFFQDYNGRYLGNIIVLILTRSNIIKTIVMAFTFFGIIYFSSRIVNKNIYYMYISLMFFLFLPIDILRQSVVWTSGFSNYAISALLILIFIYLIKDIFQKYEVDKSKIRIIFFFLLSFSASLFIENITIFNIIISIFLISYSYLKYKKVTLSKIFYLLGSLFGTLFMFTNGAYNNIANHNDTYRSFASGFSELLNRAYTNYFDVIYKDMIFNNLFINIAIVLLLIISTFKFFQKNIMISNKTKFIIYSFLSIIISYATYSLLKHLYPSWEILLKYTIIFEGLFSLAFLCGMIGIIFFTIQDKFKRQKLMFYIFSIIIMVIPLLFVTPIGARNFFVTYVIFIVIINELLNNLFKIKNIRKIAKTSIIVSLTIAIYLLSIYIYIYFINNERNNYIYNESKVSKEIIIPILPYQQYLWTSTPQKNSIWETRYKLFYNINPEVSFSIISYKEWIKYQKSQ
ncbi:MAG: DUF6056 family protein [Bacilli bacterium]|nr:DUF6056 family protein [Bacilli bacterium]MDD4406970.1 DUF6056 family protein [Bacilli bacterium]